MSANVDDKSKLDMPDHWLESEKNHRPRFSVFSDHLSAFSETARRDLTTRPSTLSPRANNPFTANFPSDGISIRLGSESQPWLCFDPAWRCQRRTKSVHVAIARANFDWFIMAMCEVGCSSVFAENSLEFG
jgi:hypothetical protein